MGIKVIPASVEFTCDFCPAVKVLSEEEGRPVVGIPSRWASLRLESNQTEEEMAFIICPECVRKTKQTILRQLDPSRKEQTHG